jgi:hypothetical protein
MGIAVTFTEHPGILWSMASMVPFEVAQMSKAKKKKAAPPIVSLRGDDDYKAWLEHIVERTRSASKAHMLRNAIVDYATKHGCKPPPKKG